MKFTTVLLALLPLIEVIARPCDQCDYGPVNLLASSGQLVKRALTFEQAKENGGIRYNRMLAAVDKGEDKPGGEQILDQLTENPAGKRQYAEQANKDFRKEIKSFLGIDGHKETFYNVVLARGSALVCDATYSPETGLISADNLDKGACEGLQMSDILFWEYARVARTHNISPQRIKGIVRHQITNEDTIGIIKEIYEREKKDRTKHDISIEPLSDEFFALLGTPNGSATMYMLGDHPQAIGKKAIGSILIVHGAKNSIIFQYE